MENIGNNFLEGKKKKQCRIVMTMANGTIAGSGISCCALLDLHVICIHNP